MLSQTTNMSLPVLKYIVPYNKYVLTSNQYVLPKQKCLYQQKNDFLKQIYFTQQQICLY